MNITVLCDKKEVLYFTRFALFHLEIAKMI